ncbi:MAG TPA: hypothetical protein VKM35_08820 [Arenimonas sp.]|uniref:hypothetical protein n=1 Tax=Arenimonas sp. TaxID=1872635 RepID=UPI002C56DA97|nr:hypothetical protein [Arenimonas sp.]HMB57299.1 hypothetical protein [Arenimonas sp.]
MGFRKVAASRGAGWIIDGLTVMRSNPLPIAHLCLLFGLLSLMPLVNIAAALAGVFLSGGLVSALHIQAQGGPASAARLFDGFMQPGAFVRLLPIAMLKIGFAVLVGIVLAPTVAPLMDELVRQAGSGGPPKIAPALIEQVMPALMQRLLWVMPAWVVVNWWVSLSLPRAMLAGVPGLIALREAVPALLANLGALLVNALCALLLLLLAMLPVIVVASIAAASPGFGSFLQLPLLVLLTAAVFAFDGAVMYQAWREIFADPDQENVPPLTQIEA